MRRIQVLSREVDDQQPDAMRDLATFDLPTTDIAALQPFPALDQLEATTPEVGTASLRRTLQAQSELVDAALAEQYRQRFAPLPPSADGHAIVQVASRFGRLSLRRQVFAPHQEQPQCMPAHAVLPAHQGLIITRGQQEVACLLPQDLPFAPVARLLGWQAHTDHVLADTTIPSLVRTHGQIIRQAEQAEVQTLLDQPNLASVSPQLVPATQPRRRPLGRPRSARPWRRR